MNGIGTSEIVVILLLFVIFFGSKELPQFIRQMAKLMGKVRHYSEKVKLELNDAMRAIDPPKPQVSPSTEKKAALRKQFLSARTALSAEQRQEAAQKITEYVINTPEYKAAASVMIYLELGGEVPTEALCRRIILDNKRLVVPYCRANTNSLGIAAITDPAIDCAPGMLGIREPREPLRDNFFKSDVRLILCPGIAFDKHGKRIGRGKGYYDNFLRELRGLVPVWALAFDCQISQESFPFDYHDVDMDQVITESGLLIKKAPV